MEPSFHVSSSTGAVLESGRSLLVEHYQSEPFGWRKSGPSLSSLAEQHHVTLSSMYRCLSTASVWMQCGEPELLHLTVSHLRELVAAEPAARRALLDKAEAERWSVARLRSACDAARKGRKRKRGRPRREPEVDFVTRAVRSWVSNPERLSAFDGLRSLGDRERAQMLKSVRMMILELEMMQYRLEP